MLRQEDHSTRLSELFFPQIYTNQKYSSEFLFLNFQKIQPHVNLKSMLLKASLIFSFKILTKTHISKKVL